MRNNASVQSIDRALAIIQLFTGNEPELTLAEISGRVDLPRSTCHRLVAALVQSGFLTVGGARGRYRLGLVAAQVGHAAMEQLRPDDLVRAELKALGADSGETVGLVILEGHEVVVIERVDSPMPLRFDYGVWTRLPAHTSATGKVLLAFDERWPDIVEEIVLAPRTPNTTTSLDAFRAELKQIRANAYAIDNEQTYLGLVCLAVPVRDPEGAVVASLALSGPSARMRPEHFDRLLGLLHARASAISNKLRPLPTTGPRRAQAGGRKGVG
jgi:DNA-binding IclR family transcriptional regulator